MTFSLAALFLLLGSSVAVEPIDADRFRLTVRYNGHAHVEAQLALIETARRLCKGKGRAVSAGTLHADEVPKTDPARKRGRLKLSEEWRCDSAAR